MLFKKKTQVQDVADVPVKKPKSRKGMPANEFRAKGSTVAKRFGVFKKHA